MNAWRRASGLLLCAALCLLGNSCALPQRTKPIVKIGLVAPFEGRYRTLGYEALYAVKWAVHQRNETGGVAGYMVELAALDDGDDARTSALQADKFAVDPDVMGVVGPFSAATVQSAAPVYHRQGLATITPATCPPPIAALGYREVLCLGASVDTWEGALADRVPPGARVTLIRPAEDDLGNGPALAAEQVFIAPEDDAIVDALRDHPADVYVIRGDVLSAVSVLTAMRRAGIEAPLWGGPSLARTQLPQIAGAASSGACYVVTAPLLADLSPASPFVTGYRELSGSMPGPWASLAYDATTLLLDALEQEIQARGRPTRAGVAARLADAVGPDGKPVFAQGQRREAGTKVFCYEPGDGYPGRVSE